MKLKRARHFGMELEHPFHRHEALQDPLGVVHPVHTDTQQMVVRASSSDCRHLGPCLRDRRQRPLPGGGHWIEIG